MQISRVTGRFVLRGGIGLLLATALALQVPELASSRTPRGHFGRCAGTTFSGTTEMAPLNELGFMGHVENDRSRQHNDGHLVPVQPVVVMVY